ncbi:hypothetical protein B0T19DRAFT_58406 [Cercophora scortea]|uniref:Uncharacterized protein n=1 Tax=Cercophora scortea TaxID=314031 RepID=A0AAE0J532_9PEZI|nr:hypothetical protein B0T19DRAFT_58406 [Cercophora scortea]
MPLSISRRLGVFLIIFTIVLTITTTTTTAVEAIVLPDDDNALTAAAVAQTPSWRAWRDPVPGTKALLGRLHAPVGKRDCLANGTSFCFGDTTHSCPGCGTCCVEGMYCCPSGCVCCGTGSCCAGGQVCSQGKCAASVVTVTATSTVYITTTYFVTRVATIVVQENDVSTVISTIEVTISSAAIQTDVSWVVVTAATAAAKRTAPEAKETRAPRYLQFSHVAAAVVTKVARTHTTTQHAAAPAQRQAIEEEASGETSTVTEYITRTTGTRSDFWKTVTVSTTAHVMTTVYRTVTRYVSCVCRDSLCLFCFIDAFIFPRVLSPHMLLPFRPL